MKRPRLNAPIVRGAKIARDRCFAEFLTSIDPATLPATERRDLVRFAEWMNEVIKWAAETGDRHAAAEGKASPARPPIRGRGPGAQLARAQQGISAMRAGMKAAGLEVSNGSITVMAAKAEGDDATIRAAMNLVAGAASDLPNQLPLEGVL